MLDDRRVDHVSHAACSSAVGSCWEQHSIGNATAMVVPLGWCDHPGRTPSRRTPARRQALEATTRAMSSMRFVLYGWGQDGSRSHPAQKGRREGCERQLATAASTLSRYENSQRDWLPRYV